MRNPRTISTTLFLRLRVPGLACGALLFQLLLASCAGSSGHREGVTAATLGCEERRWLQTPATLRGDPERACRHLAYGFLRGAADRSVAVLVLDCLTLEDDGDIDTHAELLGSFFEGTPRSGWHRRGLNFLVQAARMNGQAEALRLLELRLGRLDSTSQHLASPNLTMQ